MWGKPSPAFSHKNAYSWLTLAMGVSVFSSPLHWPLLAPLDRGGRSHKFCPPSNAPQRLPFHYVPPSLRLRSTSTRFLRRCVFGFSTSPLRFPLHYKSVTVPLYIQGVCRVPSIFLPFRFRATIADTRAPLQPLHSHHKQLYPWRFRQAIPPNQHTSPRRPFVLPRSSHTCSEAYQTVCSFTSIKLLRD